MNRIHLEHIIRAASRISADTEIVVIGSAAGREKDMAFNQALIGFGRVGKETLMKLAAALPIDDAMKAIVIWRIEADFALGKSPTRLEGGPDP